MIIIRCVIVVSMKEDSDAWIIASSGAVDQKEHIVQVRAQVMFWDNSTGLWGRSSGGGISNVCLFKVVSTDANGATTNPTESFYIQAQRISDKNMLLNCQVTKELEYTCVNNSMLHHWCVAGHKYGLTFQSPSEASQFYEAVCGVLQLLKSCASHKVSKWSGDPPAKTSLTKAQNIHLKKLSGTDSKDRLVISQDLSCQGAEGSLVLPFIPEEDQELVPPPKMKPSATYGTVKKPRAKTPPASPSQLIEHRLPTEEEDSSSLFRFHEHCPLDQWGTLHMQSTSQAVTNEYIPSPHRITLSSYRYNDPVGRNVFLKNEQDLAEKEALVVQAGSGRSLGRRNSFQSISESYVHLTKNDPCGKHDYSYPTLYSVQNQSVGFGRSHSNPRISSVVAPPIFGRIPAREIAPSSSGTSIPLPKKSTGRHRRRSPRPSVTARRYPSSSLTCTPSSSPKVRCLYCQEHFTAEEMSRGTCKDAPDRMLKCIKTATCFCCAEAALYHCAAEGEDEFEDLARERDGLLCSRNCKRSMVLALVCMLVPCLWCYPVLRACHRCAVRVGWTGPRHRPV